MSIILRGLGGSCIPIETVEQARRYADARGATWYEIESLDGDVLETGTRRDRRYRWERHPGEPASCPSAGAPGPKISAPSGISATPDVAIAASSEATMRNHPSRRAGHFGRATLEALEGDVGALLEASDVDSLGTRVRDAGEHTYYLSGFVFDAHGQRRRFYVLHGGAGEARTLLDAHGVPVADRGRPGRGLSADFRAWIARAAASDRERYGA